MSLTTEQRRAVEHDGNLILTACPGSGETRTIIAKLLGEIDRLRDTPRAAACITYTNTAVEEIQQRVAASLQPGDDRNFTVCTIHSFCLNQLLRPFAWLTPEFNGAMKVLTRDRPEFEGIAQYAGAQVNFFNLSAADYETFGSLNLDAQGRLIGVALNNEPVRRAAPHFWRRCQELGFIDFANIVYRAYRLLRDQPLVARSVASKFASFVVDEFQDTTELQIEILKLVHQQDRSRIFAVGDPAQSIFAFAGARPELLLPFAEYIAARTDLSLSGNFRSSPPIVAHAELLFPRNPPMRAVGKNARFTELPELVGVNTTFEAITEHFLPWLADLGIDYGHAAILAREWGPLFPLARQLREFGVPVVGPGARPYRRSRLFASLAEQLCGFIMNPESHNIHQLERALFHAVEDATGQAKFEVFSHEGRLVLVRLIREATRLAKDVGASYWLDSMSRTTGQVLEANGLIDHVQSGLFFASVQEMKADMTRQNVDIANLTVEDLGLFANPERAIRLTTIHAAKGREYTAVALINLREGRFPHFRADDIEAEKRLFYVAVTRAERVLMYVAERDRWGNPPSRFLGPEGVRAM